MIDIRLEKQVLGDLLFSPSLLFTAGRMLDPETFTDPFLQDVFRALYTLVTSGQPANIVSVRRQMMKDRPGREDPALMLAELSGGAMGSNCEYNAAILWELRVRRAATQQLGQTLRGLNDPSEDLPELLEGTATDILTLLQSADMKRGRSMADISAAAFERIEKLMAGEIVGLRTGIENLDNILGGFHPGELVLIAGRPAMGKTDVGLNIVLRAAEQAHKSAFLGLEMTDVRLYTRALSILTEFGKAAFTRGHPMLKQGGNWAPAVSHAREHLQKIPLAIEDMGNTTPSKLRQKLIEAARDGVKLVVLDYLGLVDLPTGKDTRTNLIGDISRMLKVSAKELDICIVALHQLSRAVETRGGDKRPILSDLRDSGNLEQDADAVLFLYRPDYYGFEVDDSGQATVGTLEIIVAKNREGETGIQILGYNPAIGKLSSSVENNLVPF